MATGDLKRIIQISSSFSVDELNNALRDICEMIYKQEGRSGPVSTRDSMSILADSNDLPLTMTSGNSLIEGTQIALSAEKTEIIRGATKTNGLYIPTGTSAQIFALEEPTSDFDGGTRTYLNTGLTPGVPFLPTVLTSASYTIALQSGALDLEAIGTTFTDVPGLSFEIAASETWVVFATLYWSDIDAAGDLKLTFTGPASPTATSFGISGAVSNGVITAAYATTFGDPVNIITQGIPESCLVTGRFENGTTAGTIQLQAAQNTASATGTSDLAATGWLIAFRVDS